MDVLPAGCDTSENCQMNSSEVNAIYSAADHFAEECDAHLSLSSYFGKIELQDIFIFSSEKQ